MKEMRLFEIGFKDNPRSTGYMYKFNVVARNAKLAERKARHFIVEDHKRWWERDGKKDVEYEGLPPSELETELQTQLDELGGLHLAKLLDIGMAIV